MQELFNAKHQNGYYFIYYIDLNGNRKNRFTKFKIRQGALKVLSNFDELIQLAYSVQTKSIDTVKPIHIV